MLRKRIEKLERNRPSGRDDLMARLEIQAMASLTQGDQALLQRCWSTSPPKRTDPALYASAAVRWQEAFANHLGEVSDQELDQIILKLSPDYDYRASPQQV